MSPAGLRGRHRAPELNGNPGVMAAASGSFEPLLSAHKSDAEQPSSTKEVGGSQTRETEGGARQEWERSCADKEGRETRTHSQKSEQGKDKGITRGEETQWGRAFLTWPAPSSLLLSLFARPVRGCQGRALSSGLIAHTQEDFPECPGFALLL